MSKQHLQQETSVLKDRWYHLPELIAFEGEAPADVLARIAQWLKEAQSAEESSGFFKQLAHDSHQQYHPAGARPRYRIAVTAYGETELKRKLLKLQKLIFEKPKESFSFPTAGLFYGASDPGSKIAYLFAGQGAQYLGMGGPLAQAFPLARQAWDTLGRMKFEGHTIKEMVFPAEGISEQEAKFAFLRLCGAEWTNPTIGVAAEAILNLLDAIGVRPDAVASHSFGDIAALRAAGVLSGEDMIKVTRRRGEIGSTCPQATRGCILVAPLSGRQAKDLLAANDHRNVWVANYNTPTQTVLTGVKSAIVAAHAIFEKAGIRSLLIPISAAPHCLLAIDASQAVYEYLREIQFNKARCDFYSFLFGRKMENDPELFRKMVRAHIEKPVRFQTQIEQMHQDGIHTFIEVGPSDILTGLVGQILEGQPHLALNTDQKKGDAVLTFINVVAELFKSGRVKTLAALWEGYKAPSHRRQTGISEEGSVAETEKRLRSLDLEFAKIDAFLQGRDVCVSAG